MQNVGFMFLFYQNKLEVSNELLQMMQTPTMEPLSLFKLSVED